MSTPLSMRRIGAAMAAWSAMVTVVGALPARAAAQYPMRVFSSPAVPTQILVDGQIADSWGLNWMQVAPGTHTLSFTHVPGYTEPAPGTWFPGYPEYGVSFTPRGELRVTTLPALPSEITVDGAPRDDWGVWTDLPAGSHTVCFGAVAGYNPPACQTATVTAGQQTTITGTFTSHPGAVGQSGVGLLRAVTSPAVPSQILVDGQIADSWGLNWLELAPGPHTVTFTHVPGYTEPASQTVTITAGSPTTVTGAFIQRGTLRVSTSPSVAATISVDGIPRDAYGMWTDLPAASYSVCFGTAPGYANAPPCQTVAVNPGVETDVTGIYELSKSGVAWGNNANGQLGNGTTTDSSAAAQVSLASGTFLSAVAAGLNHNLAITTTGSVLSWGYNANGELGNGSTTGSSVPAPVSLPSGTTVTAAAAGYDHSLAVTSTGSVLSWGNNAFGQLGNGSTTGSDVPVPVSLPSGTTVTAVAAGYDYSLALTSTGSVLAWGYNGYGQLGNATATDSSVPVAVSLLGGTTVTALAAGYGHSLAVTSTGSVLAWGYNAFGQLGNGTTTDSTVPVPVGSLGGTTVTSVAAGYGHSLALTSTGSVFAWGYNFNGELGNGTNTDSTAPVSVSLPSGTTVSKVASGQLHSLALTSTGSVLAWGYNNCGQLGDGNKTDSNVPVLVILPNSTPLTATDVAGGQLHSLAVVQ